MNRLLMLFVFLGFVCQAFGQDSLNRTDVAGRKQGRWKKTDKEGQIVYDGQFKDGIPWGTFRYYYTDGKLKTISALSDGGNTARTVSFANNGLKIAEGKYFSEKKDSIWRYYSDHDGILLSEESYTSGIKNGLSKTFFPNGKLAELIHYRQGKKDGEWVQYFDDGQLKLKGYFVSDEKEGIFTGYYPGGKKNFSGSYKEGHRDGPWVFYEEEGAVMRSETYSEGALVKENKQ